MDSLLTVERIHTLFRRLDVELKRREVVGELHVVGGAVMCLVFDVRESTRDVDALMRPSKALREAAAMVGADAGVSEDWLNDAVAAYLTPTAEFDAFLDLPNLRVFVARPEYLLALKCASMRLGEEFHDLDDVRFLLRSLNITTAERALAVIEKYLDTNRLAPKARLALEEILGG